MKGHYILIKMKKYKLSITVSSLSLQLLYYRKIIELPIIDEESYEKSLIMYVNLGEPRQIAGQYYCFFTKIINFYLIFINYTCKIK